MRRGERIDHFETERQRKDGTIIPVTMTISPIRDEQAPSSASPRSPATSASMQRAHQELRQREALLRSILDTVPDALIVIDERGIIQSFSAAAGRLFGFSAAEVWAATSAC